MTEATTASDLFQIADESRYTWDKNFPGYSADVQLLKESTLCTDKICINCDLSVEVASVTDDLLQEGIYTQLREQVIQEYINGQSFKTEFSYSNIKLLKPVGVYS